MHCCTLNTDFIIHTNKHYYTSTINHAVADNIKNKPYRIEDRDDNTVELVMAEIGQTVQTAALSHASRYCHTIL